MHYRDQPPDNGKRVRSRRFGASEAGGYPSSRRTGLEDHARECLHDSDTGLPHKQMVIRSRSTDMTFGGLGEDPLSTPTGCHSDHTGAFILSVKTEKKHHRSDGSTSLKPPSDN